MIVSGSYPNLVNGVSQQAQAQRLASQAEAIENALCSVVEGVHKRPPTNHLKRLTTDEWTDGAIHVINRDVSERYVVVINAGDLKVFDLTGAEKTVTFPNGKDYLTTSSTTRDSIRALSIADYTFILNREKMVAMAADTSAATVNLALVWVQVGVVGHKYRINIGGVQKAEFTQASGTVETSAVAAGLKTALEASLGTTDWSFEQVGNVLILQRKDNADFDFQATDTYGNQAMTGFKGKVARYSQLPASARPGMVICVAGDADTGRDDYYVTFVAQKAGTSAICQGTWEETIAPGTAYKLDRTTMPHVLVRNGDGTFTFRQGEWEDRTVGDTTTCRSPSFVGSTLRDVIAFRNRLGFLSGEKVILSEVSSWFNFFRTTVVTLLDDSPIDVTLGGTSVATLNSAVPFLNKLLLFSDQAQYSLASGQDVLTSKSVYITQTTRFEGLPNVKPVNAGNSVLFAFPRGDYSGVREYFVQSQIETADAADITAHVPHYIDGTITHMTVSTTEECLAIVTDSSHYIYIYQWKWAGDQKVQSAWSRWSIDGTPLMVEFLSDQLYLLIQRTDGVYLERLNMAVRMDTDSTYLTHLDRRWLASGTCLSYDGTNTLIGVPYTHEDMTLVTAAGDALVAVGEPTTSSGLYWYPVIGDFTDTTIWCGTTYMFSYTFTPPFLKQDATGGGLVALQDGRIQVQTMSVRFDRTAQFVATVSGDGGRSFYNSIFTGRTTGANENRVGQVALESGTFKFPVRCRNEDMLVIITNESFLPAYFLSAEWTGNFTPRSRRV